jgi:thermitase
MKRSRSFPTLSLSSVERLLLIGVLLLVIISCSAGIEPLVAEKPLSAGKPEPTYLLTIPLSPSDTLAGIERDTGGQVMVWHPGAFAIVGLESDTVAQSSAGGFSTLSNGGSLEANQQTFLAGGIAWMSGKSHVWGGGKSHVWGGGRSQVWGGGSNELWKDGIFRWMPENTAAWQQIRLEEGHAWAGNLGYRVKVAVIDSGVDLEHPALLEALAPADEWWDFYGDDPVPQEEGALGEGAYGHGTNVAGTVRQVAPRATILPLRVLGPDGSGSIADVAAAIAWAVEQGAGVINLSLGSVASSDAVEAAIKSATREGVLVVSSTGNTGDTAVTYPAASSAGQELGWQRLSVTSVDAEDNKSAFATYGEVVELSAPGEDVYGPAPGEQQAAWTGTSMAAPMASGGLALALGERLKVPAANLADELRHRAYHDIYNNRNTDYQHLLGRGRMDLFEFLRNVVDK